MLVLNILSLTDQEKAEMRATDPRAREILERTEALTPDELMRLHGTILSWQVLRSTTSRATRRSSSAPARTRWTVDGIELQRARRMWLEPRARAATSSTSPWPSAPP